MLHHVDRLAPVGGQLDCQSQVAKQVLHDFLIDRVVLCDQYSLSTERDVVYRSGNSGRSGVLRNGS